MDYQALFPGPGSPYHYAFLWLPAEKKKAIFHLLAWLRLVEGALFEVTDPTVALSKLGFWAGEVKDWAQNNKNSHPISDELKQIIKHYQLPEESFYEIIDGIATLIKTPNLVTEKELSLFMMRRYGHFYMMVMAIIEPFNAKSYKSAQELSGRLAAAEFILDLPFYYAKGCSPLPSEWFIKEGIYEKGFKISEENSDVSQLNQLLQHLKKPEIQYGELGEYKAIYALLILFEASIHRNKGVRWIAPLKQLWLSLKTHLFL